MMAVEQSEDIGKLIEDLTKNANLELNEDIFKKIKHLCRLSPKNVSHAFYLLMTQLRKEHAEVRYIILVTINELFLRSCEFRKLLERNLEEFLELTLETNPKKLLPPPKAVAQRLKTQAQHFIKSWHHKFGSTCKRLDVAYSFLKKCKNINLDSHELLLNSEDILQRRESSRRETNTAKKICAAKKEMEDMLSEISDALTQIENCFELVIPLPDDIFSSPGPFKSTEFKPCTIADDHETMKECSVDKIVSSQDPDNKEIGASLRQHGISGIKSDISIEVKEISSVVVEENEDNAPILENLNSLYQQISSKYLPAVISWSKIFSQGENCEDSLKKAIDLKQSLEFKVAKFKKLNFLSENFCLGEPNTSVHSDDSDYEFEEVQDKEDFEHFIDPEIGVPLLSTSDVKVEKVVQPQLSEKRYEERGYTVQDSSDCLKSAISSLDQPSTSNVPDWQDPELLEDIEGATGINLKLPIKRKSRSNKVSQKKRNKKDSLRTNIKASKNTSYNRLYKKIFKK